MEPKNRATIDMLVSSTVWDRFPALHVSLRRWADQARDEAAGFVVSAVPIQHDYYSVRVTRVEGDGHPMDWCEWLIPGSFRGCEQSAIDHLAAREMHRSCGILAAREGGQFPPSPLIDPPAEACVADLIGRDKPEKGEGKTMATRPRNRPRKMPAASTAAAGAGPAPGRRATARKPEPMATAPRAETRAAATKAAKPATPAARASKPAASAAKTTTTTAAKTTRAAKPAKSAPAKTEPAAPRRGRK